MITNFTVRCSDGRLLAATKYQASELHNHKLLLINSALGVRQEFYRDLSLFLVASGYTVITWDPRGIGLSAQRDIKNDRAKLRDWGKIDLESVLQHITRNNWAEWEDITLLGHSAGGHLVGLCPSIERVNNIILMSAGTCSWHLYSRKYQPKMLFAWYVWFPILSKIIGYIPRKFGLGHDLPIGIVQDWRNWSINKEYLFADESLGELFYGRYQGKIQAIGFSDDFSFSPKSVIEDLLRHFVMSDTDLTIFTPEELGTNRVGHFSFFNKKNKELWKKVLLEHIRL